MPSETPKRLERLCKEADALLEDANALKAELTRRIESSTKATGYDGIDRRRQPRRDP